MQPEQPKIRELSLDQLERPLTPKQLFLKEANELMGKLVIEAAGKVLQRICASDYEELKRHAQHSSPTLTEVEKSHSVRVAAATVAEAEAKNLDPIYHDFEQALRACGVDVIKPGETTPSSGNALDPIVVKKAFDEAVRVELKNVVEDFMTKAYNEFKAVEARRETALLEEKRKAAEDARLAAETKRQAELEEQRKAAEDARVALELRRQAEERRWREESEKKRQMVEEARIAREEASANQKKEQTPEQKTATDCRRDLEKTLKIGSKLETNHITKWIGEGLKVANERDRLAQKLKNTGLITYAEGPDGRPNFDMVGLGKIGPSSFRYTRNVSYIAWGGTIAVMAGVGWCVATGGMGMAAACGLSFLVNAANTGVQAFLKKRFDDRFTNTWKEIQTELNVIDPSRVPALTGVMCLLVDKYSPIPLIARPNRTKYWLPGQPSSTQAVLDHLKEACSAALNNIAQNTEGYYKGMDVKEKLNLAHTGISNLEKRWKWHFKQCDWWSTNLTVASGFGAVCFGLALTGF